MSPSSITIKLDFGSEPGSANVGSLSVQGDLPTPVGFNAAALAQAEGAVPTPLDGLVQVAGLQDQAPTPFSGLGALAEIGMPPVPSPEMTEAITVGKEATPPRPEDLQVSGDEKGRAKKT